MAKFEEVFPDTQNLFNRIIDTADLQRFVNIKILSNVKLKEVGKVVKANDLVRHMTNEDLIIIINEKIFEQLDEAQQIMQAEELIASIHYDNENDKLVITKPDIVTYSGLVSKYSWEDYIRLRESIKSLFSQAEQNEAETEAITN
jgi:alpha-D-ribose 1-methylphosphonate 5-triphosphate synthase subunit PhnI